MTGVQTCARPIFASNISVGNGSLTLATINSGSGRLINSTVNGNISLYTSIGGVSTRALSINGATGEVTVSQGPSNSMALTTKAYVDNNISTATAPLATINSPALTGIPTAPNVAFNANTTQLATIASVQGAITTATTAPWLGSQKTVSTNLPVNGVGNPGDFWFQI